MLASRMAPVHVLGLASWRVPGYFRAYLQVLRTIAEM